MSNYKCKNICSNTKFNHPDNIDEYKFEFKDNFLSGIDDLYYSFDIGKKIVIDKSINTSSPKLTIRDILTTYVVKDIFANKSENNLLHIINKIMKILYQKYFEETGIRLYFVYRGGNVLKIYKDNFENSLPGVVRQYIKQEFSNYFKMSDIDFYTVIGDYENINYENILQINNDIQVLCYYGAFLSRMFIMNNPNLFQFCKFNKEYIAFIYQDIINSLNKNVFDTDDVDIIGLGFNNYVYTIKNELTIEEILNIPEYLLSENIFKQESSNTKIYENLKKFNKSGRFDIHIKKTGDCGGLTEINKIDYNIYHLLSGDYENKIKEMIKENGIFDFYITNNDRICDKIEQMDFRLVRLMMNFLMIYKKNGKYGIANVNSELYDFSIGQPNDKMYKIYSDKNLIKYKYKYDFGKDCLYDEIYIPSIDTSVNDLMTILFEYRDFPWEDAKYEKRIRRIMLLIFVNEFSYKSLNNIRNILSSTIIQHITTNKIDFNYIKYKNNIIYKKLSSEEDFYNFKKYISVFDDISHKLINIIDKLKLYIETEGKIF